MAISKTGIQQPFPYRSIDQNPLVDGEISKGVNRYLSLPTPETLKEGLLFGIPLRSTLTGQTLGDNAIERAISAAISEVEHTLDIYITPVQFEEKHDYSRHNNYWAFGYLKVDHGPILTVDNYKLTFNNNIPTANLPTSIDIPLEFIHVQPMEQTVQLVPAVGANISGVLTSVFTGLNLWSFASGWITNWPGAVVIKYTAGFKPNQVPALLAQLIENIAAYKILSLLSPILFPYNSVGVSIDGVSQSTGTLGPTFFANRLRELEGIIAQQYEAAKSYYLKRWVVDNLNS
jgi:hypothetical protein